MYNEDVALIGLGRVGTYLFHHLRDKGIGLSTVIEKDRGIIKRFKNKYSGIQFSTQIKDIKSSTTLLFICVPDDTICEVTAALSGLPNLNSNLLVAHTSGALSSDILSALQEKNIAIGSFHPCASFTSDGPLDKLPFFFAIEGKNDVLNRLEKMVTIFNAKPVRLKREQKVIYHTACVTASNFCVMLLCLAEQMLNHIQVDMPMQILMPLVQSTFQNVMEKGPIPALTGPVARGDENTIRQHMNVLRQFLPHLLKPYICLSQLTLQMAASELDENRSRSLMELFETYI